jgi:hypothetical protein
MTEIQPRRLRRSLLLKIRQKQGESTYRYAETLFNRIDDLEREIKQKQDDIKACNKILFRLLIKEGIDRIPQRKFEMGNKKPLHLRL